VNRVENAPLHSFNGEEIADNDGAARGDGLAVVAHVVRDVAGGLERRRLVPQDLLDRVRDERGVGDEGSPLVGVIGEQLAGVSTKR
jgi:hypothetical protein